MLYVRLARCLANKQDRNVQRARGSVALMGCGEVGAPNMPKPSSYDSGSESDTWISKSINVT